MKRRFLAGIFALLLISTPFTGCSNAVTSSISTANSYDLESMGKITTYIDLDTLSATGDTSSILIDGNKISILAGGNYSISGTATDGQIIVDTENTQDVYIELNNANITCSNSAPIYIKSANKTILSLADNTQNYITDGETYEYDSGDEPDAAIYSKDDLIIIGNGYLEVNANFNDGITGKDDLTIQSGNIIVNSLCDGIRGKDSLTILSGTIDITAGKDGLKSNNDTDEGQGNVVIEDGTITINSTEDGIQGENSVTISNADINITTGGGSENAPAKSGDTMMGGGIKGGFTQNSATDGTTTTDPQDFTPPTMENGTISGSTTPQSPAEGTVPEAPSDTTAPTMDNTTAPPDMNTAGTTAPTVNNTDIPSDKANSDTSVTNTTDTTATTEETSVSSKAIKATGTITINSGTFIINSCDDSIHSNDSLVINGGIFDITSGDDGLHADSTLDINDCELVINKSYEGIESETLNINGGSISVTSTDDGINVSGGNDSSSVDGRVGQNTFASSGSGVLTITGGTIYVDSTGDGLDANGSISMSGGTVIVNGPSDSGNGYLDYDSTFNLTGGLLIASGSSGMAQTPSDSSTQNSLVISLTSQSADTLVNITDSSGENIITFAPKKQFESIVISSADLKTGETYNVSVGGSSDGNSEHGLISNGTYSGGTLVGSTTISTINTNITMEGASQAGSMGVGGGKGNMMNGSNGTRPTRN